MDLLFLATKIGGMAAAAERVPPRLGLRPHEVLIIQIIIIALALGVLWWIFKGQKKHYLYDKNDTPLDILNKRYASGEVTKEQYENIKKDLN